MTENDNKRNGFLRRKEQNKTKKITTEEDFSTRKVKGGIGETGVQVKKNKKETASERVP